MKLEQLRTNAFDLDENAFIAHIIAYRNRRNIDLAKAPIGKKKTPKRKASFASLGLTPEEQALTKTLGLSYKDIIRMKGGGAMKNTK